MIEHALQGNVSAHPRPHRGNVNGLANEIHGPHRKPTLLAVGVVERGDENNRDMLKLLALFQPPTHFQAIHVWHHDVQQQ